VTDADAAQTKRLVEACRQTKAGEEARVYHVRGQDGKEYVVAVNESDAEAHVAIDAQTALRLLTPEAARLATDAGKRIRLTLAARACAVLSQ